MKNLTTSIKLLFIAIGVAFMLSSCEEENVNPENLQDGFSEEIENFVPDSTIQKMRKMGMVINEGKQPPTIEGSFLTSPNALLSSSVPNERYENGRLFADYQYRFFNQNNQLLSVDLITKGMDKNGNVFSESTGSGAFLSGYGDDFTAFLIQEGFSLYGGDTAYHRILEVVSGTITEAGIENFHQAIWMLDDYGDTLDKLIPVNSGRVFYDSDSLAANDYRVKSANLESIYEEVLASFVSE